MVQISTPFFYPDTGILIISLTAKLQIFLRPHGVHNLGTTWPLYSTLLVIINKWNPLLHTVTSRRLLDGIDCFCHSLATFEGYRNYQRSNLVFLSFVICGSQEGHSPSTYIRVPKLFDYLIRKRVLTMGWMTGESPNALLSMCNIM